MSNVTRLEPRRRPAPPFARLSKVLTEPDLPLTASERLVALVIFQHARMTDMRCWPSVNTICRRSRASKNTVYAAIKKLEELGLMEVHRQRRKGKFDRNIYDFTPLKSRLHRVPD